MIDTLLYNVPSDLHAADERLELVIIGKILLDPPVLDKLAWLTTNHFTNSLHRQAITLLLTAWQSGAEFHTDSLAAGDSVLYALMTDAIYVASGDLLSLATDLAPQLRELAEKRRLYGVSVGIAQMLYNDEPSAEVAEYIKSQDYTETQDTEETPEEPHPLDIAPKEGLCLGWVDQYADLMTLMTGAPHAFNRLAGLVVAATAIQRRARLRMAFGDIYPNIFAAVIAPSSVYHKSSALAKPRTILQRAMLDNLLLSELFTSEGLLKQLQAQPAGLALRDEIGTLFASHNTKYLATLKPDLTALFDCYPYSRRLSNDEVKVQSPYLNILGATTPTRFFEGVSHVDWQDGFLARWLFVMPSGEPDFEAMTGLYTTEHDASLGRLAMTLLAIDRQPETDFVFVDDAFKLWDVWQRQAAKSAYYFGDDVCAAIVTRYAAYALKFAMILAATNDSWGTITASTMQTAIDLADSFKATVYRLLAEKANYGVSGAKLQKIFRVIKSKGGITGISQREIGQFCHMSKSELEPCMDKLKTIGAIIPIEGSKTTRYIPAVESLPAKVW